MAVITLKANRRTIVNKGANTQLRLKGIVPGIFYSKRNEPIPVEIQETAFNKVVFTPIKHLIKMELDSKETLQCIVKDVQFDPVSDRVVHFDLLGVADDEYINITVPLVFKGTPEGVKTGGILQEELNKIKIACLPADMPEHLELSISKMKSGETMYVSDLHFDKIKVLSSPEIPVVHVAHPRVEAVVETETPKKGKK